MEIDFNLEKEWAIVKSETFKRPPQYSNPNREILLKLQVLLGKIEYSKNAQIRFHLMTEYISLKDMYFHFENCQD